MKAYNSFIPYSACNLHHCLTLHSASPTHNRREFHDRYFRVFNVQRGVNKMKAGNCVSAWFQVKSPKFNQQSSLTQN